MRWSSRKDPDPNRAGANKAAEQADDATRAAWRYLAQAGAPRCPKGERARHIESARAQYDRARFHVAEARRRFSRLDEHLRKKDERARQPPDADGCKSSGPEPSERAAVTSLRPIVEELSADARRLGQCLVKYSGSYLRPPYRDCMEIKGGPFCLFGSAKRHCCNWCGQEDSRYTEHYALDGAGFMTWYDDGVRFICNTCFFEGKDLQEPAPKPVGASSVEHVQCRPESPPAHPALPPHSPALPPHNKDEDDVHAP